MLISSFKYTNEATGKVLTVSGDGILRQFASNDFGRQRFIKLSGGKTQIASRAFNTSRVIDAVGGDLSAPTYLQIYPSHGNPNQLWTIVEEGTVGSGLSGHFVHSIRADDTDMVWDVPYGDPADGNFVQIFPFNGGDNQLWREESKPIDAVVLKSMHSNWVLDVPGFESGFALIQQYPENGGFNQAWELVGPMGSPQRIRSVSSGLFLTSSFVTLDNDTTIYQGISSDSQSQRWTLEFGSGGVGTIRNVGTGFFLSVPTGTATSATPVVGLPGDGTADHQRWQMMS